MLVEEKTKCLNDCNSLISLKAIQHFRQIKSSVLFRQDKSKKISNLVSLICLSRESEVRKQLISHVLLTRRRAAKTIKDFFVFNKKKADAIKNHIISLIVLNRTKACIKIQSIFRMFLNKKEIRKIFNKSSYVFFYSLNKQLCNNNQKADLKLKIWNQNSFINFSYSKLLNIYYVKTKSKLIKKKIFLNFYYDNVCVLDPKYAVEDHQTGFYNVIFPGQMYKVRNGFRSENNPKFLYVPARKKHKKRKKSVDSIESTSSSVIEEILNSHYPRERRTKSILRTKRRCRINQPKQVSFNTVIEFSY